MSVPAAFQATFADFKLVKTRRVAQLLLEVPLEQADAALAALGGLPKPDAEAWVAVARLDPSRPSAAPVEPAKERRAFCELPFAQQSAMKSNDRAFMHFMRASDEADCAHRIRRYCGVETRSDIIAGTPAGDRWTSLLREFDGVR